MNLWPSKPLREFCVEIEDRCGGRDLPVFSVSKNLGIVLQAERFKKRIASANTSRYKVALPGDFVFDPMLLWSGSISRNTTQTIGVVSPAYCVFRLIKGLNPRFLHLYLTQPERLPFYDSISFGTNERRRKAQFSDFTRLEMPVPPLADQERIVKLLDEADGLRKLRAQADHRTADLIPALFHEMFGDPITNPNGFRKEPLEKLIKIKSGDALPLKEMVAGGEFPVYGGNGMTGYHTKFMFDQPVIVIGRVGVYCGVIHLSKPKSWVTDNALYVSETKEELDKQYLAAALRIANLNRYAGRAAQPLVSGNRIYPVPILVPPLPLQKEFAKRVTEIRELEANQAASRERLDALFQSMLHRAFRGEL